jgi:hypothetical protein
LCDPETTKRLGAEPIATDFLETTKQFGGVDVEYLHGAPARLEWLLQFTSDESSGGLVKAAAHQDHAVRRGIDHILGATPPLCDGTWLRHVASPEKEVLR